MSAMGAPNTSDRAAGQEPAGEFVRIAGVDEIPPGASRLVHLNGYRIAVFNLDGTFYAIDDTCTHEEASLSEGPVTGQIVACPKHGSRFHILTGRVLSLPAVRPVNTYPVKVEDNAVMVAPRPQKGVGMPHKVR